MYAIRTRHFKDKIGANGYAKELRVDGYRVRVIRSKVSGYDVVTVGVKQSEVKKAIKKILG